MTIPLSKLPEAQRDQLIAAGKVHQSILHIANHRWQVITAAGSLSTFGTTTRRTPEEIAALITPCTTCPSMIAGRCSSLKGCGCNRKPEEWAILSTHHCPEKKW